MLSLIAFDWVWLVVALAIGLLTAWTIWGRSGANNRPGRGDRPIVWPQNAVRETRASDAPEAEATAPRLETPSDRPAMADVASAPPASDPADAPVSMPPLASPSDDLGMLRGISPQLVELLRSLGVSHFEQIANWTPADIERIDPYLGIFRGRIISDQWVEQAKLLAVGDLTGFTARFGERET